MDDNRWKSLGIREQMGHITSEITRARHWEAKKDRASRNSALERALELIDKTLECSTPQRQSEISRLREVTAHCFAESNVYDISLEDLERYGLSHLS